MLIMIMIMIVILIIMSNENELIERINNKLGVAMLANAFEAGSQKRATAFTYFMLNATMGFVAGAFATAIFGQFVVWNWTFRVMYATSSFHFLVYFNFFFKIGQ